MTRQRRELVGGSALGGQRSRVLRSSWLWAAMTLWAIGIDGCSVDDRTLVRRPGLVFLTAGGGNDFGVGGSTGTGGGGSEAGDAGTDAGAPDSGGSDEAGQGGVDGTSGAGVTAGHGGVALGGAAGNPAGSSGAGGSGGHLMGRCPDLDDDFVFDCDETIAKNYAFDQDTSAWTTETNLLIDWQRLDADGNSDSGSLSVQNTFTSDMDGTQMMGTSQCIPVDEQETYTFAVQISVPDGATDTKAGFQVIIYDDDDCVGSKPLDIANSRLVSGSRWNAVQLDHQVPQLAKSLSMRLVSIKPFREEPSSVLFDNVLVHRKD